MNLAEIKAAAEAAELPKLRSAMRVDGCSVCGYLTPPCTHSVGLRDLHDGIPWLVERVEELAEACRAAGHDPSIRANANCSICRAVARLEDAP